jgi:hypothetical protein
VALVWRLVAVAYLHGAATLSGLYRDVVLDSLRFVDFEKTWPVFGSEVGVFLAAALGLALVLRVRGLAILGHPVHGVLLLPTFTSVLALFLPRTPAVYQHAWLPLLPVTAIYAGLTLATRRSGHANPTLGERRPRRSRRWSCLPERVICASKSTL